MFGRGDSLILCTVKNVDYQNLLPLHTVKHNKLIHNQFSDTCNSSHSSEVRMNSKSAYSIQNALCNTGSRLLIICGSVSVDLSDPAQCAV